MKLFSSFLVLGILLLLVSCEQKDTQPKETPSPAKIVQPVLVPVKLELTSSENKSLRYDSIALETKGKELLDWNKVKDQGILPGQYRITIQKEGYKAVIKEVEVKESDKELLLKASIEPMPRKLVVEAKAFPDKIRLGEKLLDKGDLVLPGKYLLTAEKQGYQKFQQEIEIPAGKEDYKYTIELSPKLRKTQINITYSVLPESIVNPEIELKENEKIIPISPSTLVLPGNYVLSVKQPGYESKEEKVSILPAEEAYVYNLEMKPLARTVEISVKAEDASLEADQILIDSKPFASGKALLPGKYSLEVMKKGYGKEQKVISFSAGQEKVIVPVNLMVSKRELQLAFSKGEGGALLTPDVFLGKEKYTQGSLWLPGAYSIKADLKGYKSYQGELVIPVGDGAYEKKIAMELTRIECPISFEITALNNLVKPDLILINGNPLQAGQMVLYGKHKIQIQAKGFQTLEKEIEINEGAESFSVKENLLPLPCQLVFQITCDYTPGTFLNPDKILVDGKPFANEVTPGMREVEIYKSGYQPIKEQILVQTGVSPQMLLRIMNVSPRNGKIVVVEKGTTNPITTDKVMVQDTEVKNSEVFSVAPGMKKISVEAKGFLPYHEETEIAPDDAVWEKTVEMTPEPKEEPKKVVETVVPVPEKKDDIKETPKEAKPEIEKPKDETKVVATRPVLVLSKDPKTNLLLNPYKIFLDEKEILQGHSFPVGVKSYLKVCYETYQTWENEIVIPEGTDVFEINVPLMPLVKYVFQSSKNTLNLDGIDYFYAFYLDSKPIEKHHIQEQSIQDNFVYTLYLPGSATKLSIKAGYFYADTMLERQEDILPQLTQIQVYDLAAHLDKILKESGEDAATSAIERIATRQFSKLNLLSKKEKLFLTEQIARWDIKESEFYQRRERVLQRLERLLQ